MDQLLKEDKKPLLENRREKFGGYGGEKIQNKVLFCVCQFSFKCVQGTDVNGRTDVDIDTRDNDPSYLSGGLLPVGKR